MVIRTISVPCYSGLDLAHVLDGALALARPLGAHIEVTCVLPNTAAELAMLPPLPISSGYAGQEIHRVIEETRAGQQAVFELWCDRNEIAHREVDRRLDSVFAQWRQETGSIETVVMRTGRLADLSVIARPEPAGVAAERCFDAAVFAAGRPAMVVSPRLPDRILRHVIIAWNGSLEGTHALAESMPILHAAERVSIFTASSPDDVEAAQSSELAAALRWHGIEARCPAAPARIGSVGQALLEVARAQEATLIVMGAYTHSRVREVLLGGVTREVLRNCPIPAIMAH